VKACGKLYCSNCADKYTFLPKQGYYTKVRVCLKCFKAAKNWERHGTVDDRRATQQRQAVDSAASKKIKLEANANNSSTNDQKIT